VASLIEEKLKQPAVAIFLIAVTLIAFWGVLDNGFVNYDDPGYVTKNGHVQSGISPGTALWAISATNEANWHPLTWMSHALDCTLFGLDPRYHHAMSLLIHLLSSLSLFFILKWMTRSQWQSAFVALVFAIHPLHVESVAWAAERKDVLSTLFWMLTIGSYFFYRRSPGAGRYILTLVLFALGLMAKPMLITLPFVLVLLDYWPLERIHFHERSRRGGAKPDLKPLFASVREKIPFFALSIASSIVTYYIQQRAGVVASSDHLPLSYRVGNAVVAFAGYVRKTILPTDLAMFYPHPGPALPSWQIAAAALGIVLCSLFVWRQRLRRPYLVIGWLWFLGTLVPVIGLVQVGLQSMADRYMYIPLIGLAVMAAWGVPEALGRSRSYLLAPAVGLATIAMVWGTRDQVSFWKDNASLYTHALSVTADNHIAHHNLGMALFDSGKYAEAIGHFRETLRLRPAEISVHSNLARCLVMLGERREALAIYEWILPRVHPDPLLHIRMGDALADEGRTEEAIAHYIEAARLDSMNLLTRCKVAELYIRGGKFAEAAGECLRVLARAPGDSRAHDLLGVIAGKQQRTDEALREFSEAIRSDSANADAHNDLGILYERMGKGEEALQAYRAAVRADGKHANAQFNLGTALAKNGQLDEAAAHWLEAVRLNPASTEARVNLGRLYTIQGKFEEAEAQLTAALRLDAGSAMAHFNYGNLQAKRGRFADAALQFSEAVRLDPAFQPAQTALRQARKLLGR